MKHKNRFDSIVIGAGPAGSTAAYLLASNGFSVLILDKSDFPRDKLCAGLLTWKTVNLIERVFQTSIDLLKSQGVITFQSSTYGVCSNAHFLIKGKLAYPFHFVERRAYDSLWLKMALEAGAEFRPNEKVVFLDHSAKKILTSNGHEFHGNFIFGADGALSRIRQLLYKRGLIKFDWKPGLATAFEIAVPKNHAPGLSDYPIIYFGHIPWGYAWCFPGKNRRLLGICGLNAKSGKFIRNGFKDFLESLGISEKSISAPSSHALPFGNYLRNPGYGNMLLVGDACGLADPLLGEGIYYAHKSSQLAAKAAMQSYHDPDAALERYTRYLTRDILIELRFARVARQIIYALPGGLRWRVIASLFKTIPRQCEETIQGQRSFRWLRPIRRQS
jgi:geranylgeranyl reductase family protein